MYTQRLRPWLWQLIMAALARSLTGGDIAQGNTMTDGGMAQGRRLVVLYGSQTGTAEEIAFQVSCRLASAGAQPTCASLISCSLEQLEQTTTALFVVSTTGDGEPPLTMRRFWMTLRRRDLSKSCLSQLRYAVYGCGDSSYPKFNAVARRLDVRLEALGAKRLCDIVLGDEQSQLGVALGMLPSGAWEWTRQIASKLDYLNPNSNGSAQLQQSVKYLLDSRDGKPLKRQLMDFSDYVGHMIYDVDI
eukprot:542789-Hanusia_phi.AAC.4